MREFRIIIISLILYSCDSGYEKTYYDDGSIRSKSTPLENSMNGESLTYYKTGQIKSHATWENGINNGTVKLYFENGAVEQITEWKNGVLDGRAVSYHLNGKVKIKATYKNGCEYGLYKVFYENGNISELSIFDDDCRAYYFAIWNAEGRRERQIFVPLINLKRSGDSIDAEIYSPIKFYGNGFVTLGSMEKEVFYPISSKTKLTQISDHIKIPGSVDPDELYYRFDFDPDKLDSLDGLGVQKKVIQKRDSVIKRKDFMYLMSSI